MATCNILVSLVDEWTGLSLPWSHTTPAGTWSRTSVDVTSWRHIGVDMTLFWQRVPAGTKSGFRTTWPIYSYIQSKLTTNKNRAVESRTCDTILPCKSTFSTASAQIKVVLTTCIRPWAGYRPPSPPRGNFVHYDFLKQHYIRHKIKDVSPLRVAALTCNSTLYTLPPKIALNILDNVSTMTCSYIFAFWHRFMNFL